jgi:TrmH family RNA methyltransferase
MGSSKLMEKITSKQNKLIKSINKLFDDKKYRDTTNLFVAESFRVIETLIKNGFKCRNLLITHDSKYLNQIQQFENDGIMTSLINNEIYKSISTLANADGVMAVFNKQRSEFNIAPNKKYIILNKIQNPGNLGTIIRTAVGFNIDGIFITNDTVDLFHPAVIRSTMGACFSIPIKVSTSLTDVISELKRHKYTCYATTLNSTSQKVQDVKFAGSTVVLFGNEGNGLTDKEIQLCDESIYIPISQKVDSLNVATASAIIMYLMK